MALGAIYTSQWYDDDETLHQFQLLKEGGSSPVAVLPGNLGSGAPLHERYVLGDFWASPLCDSQIQVALQPALASDESFSQTALDAFLAIRTGDPRDYAVQWVYGATTMGTWWVLPLATRIGLYSGHQSVLLTCKARVKSLSLQTYPNAADSRKAASVALVETLNDSIPVPTTLKDYTRWIPNAHGGDPLDVTLDPARFAELSSDRQTIDTYDSAAVAASIARSFGGQVLYYQNEWHLLHPPAHYSGATVTRRSYNTSGVKTATDTPDAKVDVSALWAKGTDGATALDPIGTSRCSYLYGPLDLGDLVNGGFDAWDPTDVDQATSWTYTSSAGTFFSRAGTLPTLRGPRNSDGGGGGVWGLRVKGSAVADGSNDATFAAACVEFASQDAGTFAAGTTGIAFSFWYGVGEPTFAGMISQMRLYFRVKYVDGTATTYWWTGAAWDASATNEDKRIRPEGASDAGGTASYRLDKLGQYHRELLDALPGSGSGTLTIELGEPVYPDIIPPGLANPEAYALYDLVAVERGGTDDGGTASITYKVIDTSVNEGLTAEQSVLNSDGPFTGAAGELEDDGGNPTGNWIRKAAATQMPHAQLVATEPLISARQKRPVIVLTPPAIVTGLSPIVAANFDSVRYWPSVFERSWPSGRVSIEAWEIREDTGAVTTTTEDRARGGLAGPGTGGTGIVVDDAPDDLANRAITLTTAVISAGSQSAATISAVDANTWVAGHAFVIIDRVTRIQAPLTADVNYDGSTSLTFDAYTFPFDFAVGSYVFRDELTRTQFWTSEGGLRVDPDEGMFLLVDNTGPPPVAGRSIEVVDDVVTPTSRYVQIWGDANVDEGYVESPDSTLILRANRDGATPSYLALDPSGLVQATFPDGERFLFDGTGGVVLASGTTAQRRVSPTEGEVRYNSDTVKIEGYENGAWANLVDAGGATAITDNIIPKGTGVGIEDSLGLSEDNSGRVIIANTSGAVLRLYNPTTTPPLDTQLGSISFRGLDDGGAPLNYASVGGFVGDDTAGSEGGHLTFNTFVAGANTEVVRITGGQVAIGTPAPDGTLHVHTATAGAVSASSLADDVVIENSTGAGLSILTPDASTARLIMGSVTDNRGFEITWKHDNDLATVGTRNVGASLELHSGNAVAALTLDSSQNATFAGTVGVAGLANFDADLLIKEQASIPSATSAGYVKLSAHTTSSEMWGYSDAKGEMGYAWFASGLTVGGSYAVTTKSGGNGNECDIHTDVTIGSGVLTAVTLLTATTKAGGNTLQIASQGSDLTGATGFGAFYWKAGVPYARYESGTIIDLSDPLGIGGTEVTAAAIIATGAVPIGDDGARGIVASGVTIDGSDVVTLPEELRMDFTASADYSFVERSANLTLRNRDSNTRVELFAEAGDGTDEVAFRLYGLGTVASITNRERLEIKYNTVGAKPWEIISEASGTGTERPIKIYTASNNNQLRLNADGFVGISNSAPAEALDVTGNIEASGEVRGTQFEFVGDQDTKVRNPSANVIALRAGGNDMVVATTAASVELYHNTSIKLSTESGGVAVTGNVEADKFVATGGGTSSAPVFTLDSDTDTGFFFPLGNEIGVSGGTTEIARFSGVGIPSLTIFDDNALYIGDSVDLSIVHDTSGTDKNVIISKAPHDLEFWLGSDLAILLDNTADSVELYKDGNRRLVTTTDGITLDGTGAILLPSGTTAQRTSSEGQLRYNTTDNLLEFRDASSWVQLGGTVAGDVVGPSGATDNALARFDLTTGKLLQNSVVTLTDGGLMQFANSDGIVLGTSSDSQLYSSGVNTFLDLAANEFQVRDAGNNIILRITQSEAQLYYNGSTKLTTETGGVVVTGNVEADKAVITSTGSASAPTITRDGDTNTGLWFAGAGIVAIAGDGVEVVRFQEAPTGAIAAAIFPDDVEIRLGEFSSDGDLRIYHDSAPTRQNIIDTTQDLVFVHGADDMIILDATANSVELYKDGNRRLVTTTAGVSFDAGVLIAGDCEIDGAFNHDGSTLGVFGVTPITRPSLTTLTVQAVVIILEDLGLLTDDT